MRHFIAVVKQTKVDMSEAVLELSSEAFKLLNLIYHKHIAGSDLEDSKAMDILGVSRRPYFRAKSELQEKGYVRIVKVGSTKYKWFIGKKAIERDSNRYDEGKRRKQDREFAKLVLGLNQDEVNYETTVDSGQFVLEGFEQGMAS